MTRKMSGRKRHKQPNPSGQPLPSRFERTFYEARRLVSTPHGLRSIQAYPTGTIFTDIYGAAYIAGRTGEIRKRE